MNSKLTGGGGAADDAVKDFEKTWPKLEKMRNTWDSILNLVVHRKWNMGYFVVFPLGFTQFFPQINLLANVNFWFEIQMILTLSVPTTYIYVISIRSVTGQRRIYTSEAWRAFFQLENARGKVGCMKSSLCHFNLLEKIIRLTSKTRRKNEFCRFLW